MEYEITKFHYYGTAMYRLRVLNDCVKEKGTSGKRFSFPSAGTEYRNTQNQQDDTADVFAISRISMHRTLRPHAGNFPWA